MDLYAAAAAMDNYVTQLVRLCHLRFQLANHLVQTVRSLDIGVAYVNDLVPPQLHCSVYSLHRDVLQA